MAAPQNVACNGTDLVKTQVPQTKIDHGYAL